MRFGMVCLVWLLVFPQAVFSADVSTVPKGRALDLGPDVKLMVEIRRAQYIVRGTGGNGLDRFDKIESATIVAGGARILLDVSRSKSAEEEIKNHTVIFLPGSGMSALSVKGELVFQRQTLARRGTAPEDRLIPVIFVTSAKAERVRDGAVFLTGPDEAFKSAPLYCEVQGAAAKPSKLSLSDLQGEMIAVGSKIRVSRDRSVILSADRPYRERAFDLLADRSREGIHGLLLFQSGPIDAVRPSSVRGAPPELIVMTRQSGDFESREIRPLVDSSPLFSSGGNP